MGRRSRLPRCYSIKCCCCLSAAEEACWWIAVVGLVWGAVATFLDFLSANLPDQYCERCLDHNLNIKLSVTSGCINAVQWAACIVLLRGATKGNKWMILSWLVWSVVSLAMLVVWVVVTVPYTPSLRGTHALIQLAWGIHYFLVVMTHYRRLVLKHPLPEETPICVPPNTPVRRHKLRRRRLDPASQPPIRTLIGAALRMQKEFVEILRQEEDEDDDEVVEMQVCVDRREKDEGRNGGKNENKEAEVVQMRIFDDRRDNDEGRNGGKNESEENEEEEICVCVDSYGDEGDKGREKDEKNKGIDGEEEEFRVYVDSQSAEHEEQAKEEQEKSSCQRRDGLNDSPIPSSVLEPCDVIIHLQERHVTRHKEQ